MNARENLDAVVFQEKEPERFCNNYEAIQLTFFPFFMHNPSPKYGEENVVDAWGVTNSFPEGTPGPFPVHAPDKVVIKDFEEWDKYLKAPSTEWPEEEWKIFIDQYNQIDRSKSYAAPFVAPGIFERMHHCGKIDEVCMALAMYPDECHDLIKYILDWEMKVAEHICEYIKPDSLFHHDDWGSMTSTFMSPAMFEEFFVDAYKELYGYYHDHGCKLVFHHSDSYGATLVPDMIEMGINVWQGCMASNNIPEMVKKYGDKITFMGGFDGAMVDTPDWSEAKIKETTYKVLDEVGTTKGFIPCIAQGGPGSVYKGVYDALVKAIDDYNVEKFGANREEIEAGRLPLSIMF